MNFKEHWRLRLQELLASTGMTQAAFAERSLMTPDYLSRLLYPPSKAGRKNLGEVTLRKICEAFGLPREWFDLPLGTGLPSTATAAQSHEEQGQQHAVHDLCPTDKGRALEPIEWPFTIVTYQRVRRLREHYKPRGMPAAISDIDKHLDVLVARWENEMHKNKRSAA